MPIEEILKKVREENQRAEAKHGPSNWRRHQFYGILKEEVDELWDAIKQDVPTDLLEKKVVQVISVCMRYLEKQF